MIHGGRLCNRAQAFELAGTWVSELQGRCNGLKAQITKKERDYIAASKGLHPSTTIIFPHQRQLKFPMLSALPHG